MKQEICKWHNLPKVGCPKCKEDLDKTSDFLNNIFANPKFIKKANRLFEEETKKATSPEVA